MNGLSAQTLGIMCTSIALAAAGQLLLRAGMEAVGVVDLTASSVTSSLKAALTTWQVYAGFGAFGISSALWLVTLSRVPLSTAYPFVSLTYVIIVGASYLLLDERPTGLTWLGVVVIIAGISIVGFGQR